jgi:8-oxo-dGTP diphosphatase
MQVTFRPHSKIARTEALHSAALVFAFLGERIVLADIKGRGWCIPGGRLEPDETALAAARREAWEESGAILGPLTMLGCTTALGPEGSERSLAVSYIAAVERLESIPADSEAQSVLLAARDELPACYYHWDALMEAMFDYAWEHRPLHSVHSTAKSAP